MRAGKIRSNIQEFPSEAFASSVLLITGNSERFAENPMVGIRMDFFFY